VAALFGTTTSMASAVPSIRHPPTTQPEWLMPLQKLHRPVTRNPSPSGTAVPRGTNWPAMIGSSPVKISAIPVSGSQPEIAPTVPFPTIAVHPADAS
jgi:hypothetical protein